MAFGTETKKTWSEDRRRVMHACKVGIAITCVCMFHYINSLEKGLGNAGLWAIVTEVVVFEYSVGGTLCKGLNRGLATILAGSLGLAAERFASLFSPTYKVIILGLFVFIVVGMSTFLRFIPSIKRRFDSGLLMFTLTFILVSTSGYQVDKIIDVGLKQLYTILLGGGVCMIISTCIWPVWAGQDLHELIVLNMETLGDFLEGFGAEYYQIISKGDESSKADKSSTKAYQNVLDSKATEDSLVDNARWEIGHGNFRYFHPWEQYLKIGTFTRECAYHIEALNGYLGSKSQAPTEFQKVVKEPCMKMSSEVGKALKELGLSMKLMIHPTSTIHMENCKKAIEELNSILQDSMVGKHREMILETIPVIAVTSILIDIIKCVETISEAIEELAKQAHFTQSDKLKAQRTSSWCLKS